MLRRFAYLTLLSTLGPANAGHAEPQSAMALSSVPLIGQAIGQTAPSATPGSARQRQIRAIRAGLYTQVRATWQACKVNGIDVHLLRARVVFRLDQQGRISSIDSPQVSGVTEANRAQAKPFGECAVRAIRVAAPFANLPVEYYDDWKVSTLQFRKVTAP